MNNDKIKMLVKNKSTNQTKRLKFDSIVYKYDEFWNKIYVCENFHWEGWDRIVTKHEEISEVDYEVIQFG